MKIHCIMHESFESPAAIEAWAKQRGHSVTFTKCYEGGVVPETCDFDFLVVMGGPQSPATTKEECPHYDAPSEVAFIKKAVSEGKIAFGVCLGAQLIGEALGGSFDHSPNREIGVFPITLTEDGKKDPLIGSWPQTFETGHWHGDMPGLTKDAKILATSKGCPRQIVRYTPKVYGFQCHFEFTPEAIEAMIQNSTQELADHKGKPYIETPEQLRKHDFTEINAKLFSFLDALTA